DLAEPFLAEADKIGVEDDHPGHDQRRDGLGRIDEAAPQPQAERSAVAVPIAAGAATPLARLLGRAPAVLVVDLRSRAIPARPRAAVRLAAALAVLAAASGLDVVAADAVAGAVALGAPAFCVCVLVH